MAKRVGGEDGGRAYPFTQDWTTGQPFDQKMLHVQ